MVLHIQKIDDINYLLPNQLLILILRLFRKRGLAQDMLLTAIEIFVYEGKKYKHNMGQKQF